MCIIIFNTTTIWKFDILIYLNTKNLIELRMIVISELCSNCIEKHENTWDDLMIFETNDQLTIQRKPKQQV